MLRETPGGIPSEKELILQYLDKHYKPLDSQMMELREINEAKNVPLILRETEGFLSLLMDVLKPTNILEIGTAYGYSALFFARKCKDARVTTIDRSPLMIENALINFDKYEGGARICFLNGGADEILDSLHHRLENSEIQPFDFVFIDAGKSHYKDFFIKAEKLCKPGSVVVCDNILMHGWLVDKKADGAKRHRTNVKYMRQFIDYISERADLSVSLLASGDGLAVIKLSN